MAEKKGDSFGYKPPEHFLASLPESFRFVIDNYGPMDWTPGPHDMPFDVKSDLPSLDPKSPYYNPPFELFNEMLERPSDSKEFCEKLSKKIADAFSSQPRFTGDKFEFFDMVRKIIAPVFNEYNPKIFLLNEDKSGFDPKWEVNLTSSDSKKLNKAFELLNLFTAIIGNDFYNWRSIYEWEIESGKREDYSIEDPIKRAASKATKAANYAAELKAAIEKQEKQAKIWAKREKQAKEEEEKQALEEKQAREKEAHKSASSTSPVLMAKTIVSPLLSDLAGVDSDKLDPSSTQKKPPTSTGTGKT